MEQIPCASRQRNTDKTDPPGMKAMGCKEPSSHPSRAPGMGKCWRCRKPGCGSAQLNTQVKTQNPVQGLLWETGSSKQTLRTPAALRAAHNSTKSVLLGPEGLQKPGRAICKWPPWPERQPGPAVPPCPTLLVSFFLAASSARSSSVGGPSMVPCSRVSLSISLSSFMLWVNLWQGHSVGDTVTARFFHRGKARGPVLPTLTPRTADSQAEFTMLIHKSP